MGSLVLNLKIVSLVPILKIVSLVPILKIISLVSILKIVSLAPILKMGSLVPILKMGSLVLILKIGSLVSIRKIGSRQVCCCIPVSFVSENRPRVQFDRLVPILKKGLPILPAIVYSENRTNLRRATNFAVTILKIGSLGPILKIDTLVPILKIGASVAQCLF